jgi:hypothetical protein
MMQFQPSLNASLLANDLPLKILGLFRRHY